MTKKNSEKPVKQITQFSTMNALLARLYDGAFPIKEVEAAGTIGLGCGDLMDGEMIMDHSTCYISRIQQENYNFERMNSEEKVPFAQVATFNPEGIYVTNGTNKDTFVKELLEKVQTENVFIGVKVSGTFKHMNLRLAPPASKPYPSLVKLFSQQKEFEQDNVKGVLIGFWAPEVYQGTTVAGIHVHFMDSAQTFGGHVLDFEIDEAIVKYEKYHQFNIKLPETEALDKADLNHTDGDAAIKHVEG